MDYNILLGAAFNRAEDYKRRGFAYVVVITDGEDAVVSLSKLGTEKRLKAGWRIVKVF